MRQFGGFRRFMGVAGIGVLVANVGLAAPPNDGCATPTTVSVAPPFVEGLDTTTATVEPTDPVHSCTGAVDGNTVWYQYTAPGGTDATIDIDARGSTYGTVIAVYDGTCGALVERHCFVDPSGSETRLAITVTAGTSVLIQLSDPGLLGGTMTLNVREAPYPLTAPTSLLQLATSGSLSSFGTGFAAFGRPTVLKPRVAAFGGYDTGIFKQVGGVVTKIAASGDATPIGGHFRLFGPPTSMSANVGAFWAMIDNLPGVTEGIFLFNGAVISAIAAKGDPAPSGGVFTRFGALSMNAVGDLLFAGITDMSPANHLFKLPWGGGLVSVASEGDTNPCGGTFLSFGAVDLNIWGHFAVYALGTGGAEGIVARIGSATHAVACEGAVEPTFGGTYTRVSNFALSDVPKIAFRAEVDTGVSQIDAIYAGPPTAVAGIAGTGQVTATGETIEAIDRRIIPAINVAGDVAFTAQLTGADHQGVVVSTAGGGVRVVAKQNDVCGGSTFRTFASELSMNGAGQIAFEAACVDAHGIVLGTPGVGFSKIADHRDPTGYGAGFRFEFPQLDVAGNAVFKGNRTAVFGVGCTTPGVCTLPTVLAKPGDPWPAGPAGATLKSIDGESVSGVGRPVFLGTAPGSEVIAMVRGGAVRKIVESGDPLPGGVGLFAYFGDDDPFDPSGKSWRPSGYNSKVAFNAVVDHPTFTTGVFIFRGGAIASIAGDGQPAPDGGTFVAFSSPALQGSKIAFAAETTLGSCVMLALSPAKVIKVGCLGDTVGSVGTIDAILSPPTFSQSGVTYAAAVSGAGASACLVAWSPLTGSQPLVCDGDPKPNGGTLLGFTSPDTGDVSLRGGTRGFAFSSVDLASTLGLQVWYQGALAELAAEGQPAPGTGTFVLDDHLVAMTNNTVAFRTELAGGSAAEGMFLATMP